MKKLRKLLSLSTALLLTVSSVTSLNVSAVCLSSSHTNINCGKFEKPESFHTVQKAQTAVLAVLSPVISILTVIIVSVAMIFSFKMYSNSHPEFKKELIAYAQELQLESADDWFESIEEKDGVYYFYSDPEDWHDMVKSEFIKAQVMKHIVNYVLIKSNVGQYSVKDVLKNAELLNKTKVYSEFNNEVLVEINIDPVKAKEYLKNIDEKGNYKEAMEFIKGSYKYNLNPSTP